MRIRWVVGAFAAAGFAIPAPINAQLPPQQPAPTLPGQARPAPALDTPYEDQLIGGGTLEPLRSDVGETEYNAQGWPRYWRIEAVTSNVSGTGGTQRQNAIRLNGSLDTPGYGGLTLDGTLQTGPGTSTLTLWQRGMPFDGGWRANNALGVVNTLGIDLTRAQYRFYLPTFPVVGATSEWLHDSDLQLQASVGQPGTFDGLLVSGFSSLHGSITTAGAQWAFAPQWRAGVQLTSASDVSLSPGSGDPSASFSGQSLYGTLAWQGPSTRVQANVLGTQADQGRRGVGLWLDGETLDGRFIHHYGAFRLDPNLYWGYQQVNSDQQGAYYRVNYQSQQWLWDGGADALAAVSGAGANTIYATASVRYQFDRQLGIGVAGSVRNDAGTAWSAQTFVEKQSGLGNTRLQLNSAAQERSQRATQLMLDHSWPTPIGTRLTTALSASQETAFGRTFNTAGFLIYGGGDLASNLTLDGNLRFNYTRNVGSGTGFFANVNLAWRIDPRWSVIATVYDNRDDTAKLYVIDSPAQGFASVPTQQSRAFFLTLRYEARAGLPEMPLGGARGAAAGTVAGYIYLDQNDNGRRDASESAAPSVTVLLDGRFSTRTDEHGRFEFPLVAAGTHALTVVPDNLPLPWAVPNGGRVNITVHTRETTPVEIAASRLM